MTPRLDDDALAELLGRLADEFTERLQRGEQPDVEEYARRHPAAADVLRQVLPALAACGAAPPPPATIGDYRIVREVGRGGMGIVYEAEQISFPRRVALKVLPAGPALGPGRLARFQREARTAAQLHHTNIVPVYGASSAHGVHYYAMQFIDGQGLDEVLRALRAQANARLPLTLGRGLEASARGYWHEVARIGAQVADALDYAHQRKVVHRDVKPSNLLLDGAGTVWVTDFGLVKCLDDDGDLTHSGDVLGTARYMSPEQALGRRNAIDGRSDLYSLGATLYELLTLRPVCTAADQPTILQQIAFEEPPAPRTLNAAVPRDLETIVLKAMAKDPRSRYPNAAALARDLRHYLAGEAIQARPPGALERLAKWARKRPAAAALLIVSVAAVLAFVVQISWSNAELRLANARERERAVEAHEARQQERQRALEAEQRERIARRHLYAAQMNMIQQAWERGHVARVRTLLESQLPAAGQEDLRGFEWFYYARLSHRDRFALPGHMHAVAATAVSPDGRTLATGSYDRTIALWDLPSGKRRATLPGHHGWVTALVFTKDGALISGGDDGALRTWREAMPQAPIFCGSPVVALALAPDGTLAAGCHDGTIRLYADRARPPQAVLAAHAGQVLALAFSPDGMTLASGGTDGVVYLWDVMTRQVRDSLTAHGGGVRSVAFAPDGTLLASGSDDETVRLWDALNGSERAVLRGHTDSVGGVVFAPDSQTLASVSGAPFRTSRPNDLFVRQTTPRAKPGEVKLWNVQTHLERATLKGHTGPVFAAAFTPDGRTLITGSDDATAIAWDVAGPEQATLPGHTLEINALAFAPDGATLATVSDDRRLMLWDVAGGREKLTRTEPRSNLKFVVYSPDGKLLALGGGDHDIKLWDAATCADVATLTGHRRTIRAIAFSPDGRTLATAAGDVEGAVKPVAGEIKLWDVASRTQRLGFAGHPLAVRSVAFSPDGKLLASGSDDRTVKLWDGHSGQELATLTGHAFAVRYVAFSADGRTLASASNDRTVKLWDVATRTERAVLRGHRSAVMIVVYAPDGQSIATGSADGTVKLWDAVTGQERAVLEGHRGGIRAVAFRPDGRLLATGDNEPRVKLWYGALDQR